MLSATAPAKRQQAKTRRGHKTTAPFEHLRDLVKKHQVCYEIWPLSKKGQKGFELLLCGVNGHPVSDLESSHPVASCEYCARTYGELKKIGEWVLHLRKPPLGHQIHSFDTLFT
jgi:hypothetical protein